LAIRQVLKRYLQLRELKNEFNDEYKEAVSLSEVGDGPLWKRLRQCQDDNAKDSASENGEDCERTFNFRGTKVEFDESVHDGHLKERRSRFVDVVHLRSAYCPLHGNFIQENVVIRQHDVHHQRAACYCADSTITTSWNEVILDVSCQLDISAETIRFWVS